MKRLFSFLLAALTGAPGLLSAQTTGSFNTTIPFAGGTRQLALYVPPTYNAANKYRLMICLHGLGDTCTDYRNALVGPLGWAGGLPNTILVCPEAATKTSDFYAAPGGETIISESIAMAMAAYHIDTANVILQGFSLGGRAALRYGLDHPATFKGLLLNTPALQGVKEALNGQAPNYSFTYANGPQVPIYMTHGGADIAYSSPIDSAYELLVRANARVYYQDVPGMGHTFPPLAQMPFLQFFDAPARPGADAEAVLLSPAPLLTCTAPAKARLLFRNTGQTTLQSVRFRYTLGGVQQKGTWTGTLLPFQHATFEATFPNAIAGANAVTIVIDSLNGAAPDTVAANNTQTATLHYSNAARTTLDEGFEGACFPPDGWVQETGGDFYTAWDADPSAAKTGVQSASAFNTILFFDNAGRRENLITPAVTIPAATPKLTFDVAYNYHRYTPPYFVSQTDFADTLEVFVSTDCGANYTRLYQKGGAALATFAQPITNALSVQTAFAVPADSNWRTEGIDLSSLTGAASARFKFSYRSALGGFIMIDNVRVSSTAAVGAVAQATRYAVYPNPADGVLVVAGAQGLTATLTNTLGQAVLQQRLSDNNARIALDNVAPGLYLLRLADASGTVYTTRVTKR